MMNHRKQASISKYVTASLSPAVPVLAFRGIDKSPLGDLPKVRGALLDEVGDFIDPVHTTSNMIGKRMVRVFNDTRALLGGADQLIESIQKRTADLVALGRKAENRKEFLRNKAGAISAQKVPARAELARGLMRSLRSGCRSGPKNSGGRSTS